MCVNSGRTAETAFLLETACSHDHTEQPALADPPTGVSSPRATQRRVARRGGFTLIESVLAMTLLLMAGATMLLAVDTAMFSTNSAMEELIAQGMARQILDEVMGNRYRSADVDPYQYPLTASSWEKNGNGRERFDDIDDFNGFSTVNAEDRWGQPLGMGDGTGNLRHASLRVPAGRFDGWRQSIEVYYVDPNDLSHRLAQPQTSDYRAVEVVIERVNASGAWRELARLRRVIAYVPVP